MIQKSIFYSLFVLLTLILSFSFNYSVEASGKTTDLFTKEFSIELLADKDFEIIGYTNSGKVSPQKEPRAYYVQPRDSLFTISRNNDTTIDHLKEINNLVSDELEIGQRLLISDTGEKEIIYPVKPGDTLYNIAQKYNTTINKIRELNNLQTDWLYSGQKLKIPSPPAEDHSDRDDKNTDDKIYYVQPGDTLYKIAQKYNITINKIKEYNDLNTNMLDIGQKLQIPVPDSSDSEINIEVDYRIEPGDDLISIGLKFNLPPWTIKAYNNLQTDYLRPGSTIKIPFQVENDEVNSPYNNNKRELNLLARTVYSEARGEPFEGQVAVAAVVLNRLRHGFFPNTIEDIIFQPWQFTAVHDGQFWLEPDQQAFIAAKAALKGWDPTEGAIYYYNPDTATSDWVFYRNVVIKIGDHYFAV
ncbi:MAG: LysM peptidoglycan-binding domain-containing protein [Halanaerobiales bacterium]